jgi:phage terminase large subunit-like protein
MTALTAESLLADVPTPLLALSEGRRELTRYNPLLFALVYLPHHLRDEQGRITFSEFHFAVADYGVRVWTKKDIQPMEHRDAFIAPRGCGKSTWIFTILPLWAAAHGHRSFVAAFSDRAGQAEDHLATFRSELDFNEYLRADFPDLCEPLRSTTNGRAAAMSANRIHMKNGFVFDANGIDTNALGKKVGTRRPDLIILDDIEKGEKNYSEYQAGQQKNTVFDDIAPMSLTAPMVFVGTTTMPNSVMDQFRKHSQGDDGDELRWIIEQNVQVHYFPAILQNDDGTERSVWPAKWTLEFLNSQRHTRSFAKNYMNKPLATDGQYWDDEDIRLDTDPDVEFGHTLVSVDPSVTRNKTSDYTGIAVVARGTSSDGKNRLYIRHAEQFKGSPEDLAERVGNICEQYEAGVLFVETNQGGDLWQSVFKNIPAKYRSKHQKLSKEIRAGKALNFYQQDRIRHAAHFPVLEEQMYAFPKVKHDDVLDSVVSGILYFLDNRGTPLRARQLNYMER